VTVLCDFEQIDGTWRCQRCGYEFRHAESAALTRPPGRACKANPVDRPRAPHGGAGTELKRLLGLFFLRPNDDCNCAAWPGPDAMTREGPEWWGQNIETILDWLEEAAGDRRLPFSRRGARVLVRRAIALAERREKRRKRAEAKEAAKAQRRREQGLCVRCGAKWDGYQVDGQPSCRRCGQAREAAE
jgi:DNA-directed RNA polymerase subunit RPC12/RpoP